MNSETDNLINKIFSTVTVLKNVVASSNLNSSILADSILTNSNVIRIKLSIFFLLFVSAYFYSSNSLAAAGDVITNTASINYSIAGVPVTSSADADFTEDRIVNFVVADGNGSIAVPVISNMIGAVMQFTLTNTGNDTHDFLLTALNTTPNPFGTPIDSFDPDVIQVFVESGITPIGYQALEDTAVFVDELAAGDSVTVYVVSSLPAVITNEVAVITLIAQVAEAGAVGEGAVIDADDNGRISPAGVFAGTTTSGGTSSSSVDSTTTMETVFNDPAGLNSEDIATDLAQDITGNGQHAVSGAYQVMSPVAINKSVTIIDTLGGTDPHPGAILRYQLEVSVSGNTAVDELVITDLIPANTTYVNGSISLNGVAQTDVDDVIDFSQAVNILTPPVSAIEVDLSQDTAVPVLPATTNTIIFEVTIN